jgi:hypothetical protein
MDEFRQSFDMLAKGVRDRFNRLERDYFGPEYEPLLSACREAVDKFCGSEPPNDFDGLCRISQEHTLALGAINFTANALRRQAIKSRMS